MSSKKHAALTTDSNSLTQWSTVLTLAIACGLAVANVYYNQPLLADCSSLNISVQLARSVSGIIKEYLGCCAILPPASKPVALYFI